MLKTQYPEIEIVGHAEIDQNYMTHPQGKWDGPEAGYVDQIRAHAENLIAQIAYSQATGGDTNTPVKPTPDLPGYLPPAVDTRVTLLGVGDSSNQPPALSDPSLPTLIPPQQNSPPLPSPAVPPAPNPASDHADKPSSTPEHPDSMITLEHLSAADEDLYSQLIDDGLLPDPIEYEFYPDGSEVSYSSANSRTEQLQANGFSSEVGDELFDQLSIDQRMLLLWAAGVHESDLVTLTAGSHGESLGYVQVIGDRDQGGSVGLWQIFQGTDEHLDPWVNAKAAKDKYVEFWKARGYDQRFNAWAAITNSNDAYQAGVELAEKAYQRLQPVFDNYEAFNGDLR